MNRRAFLQASMVAGLSTLRLPTLRADEGCRGTTPDGQGPFYQADAPFRAQVALPEEPGERLWVRGTVTDCRGRALSTAVVEVWQANTAGCYSLYMDCGVLPSQPDKFRLRARLRVDAEGRYELETIKPGRYGLTGGYRPSHIHYRVTVPGAQGQGRTELITQLYFEGDPYNETDFLASKPPARSRIRPLVADARGGKQCTFNIALPATEQIAASQLEHDLLIERARGRIRFRLPEDIQAHATLRLCYPDGRCLGEASFSRNRVELQTGRVRPGLYLARLRFEGSASEETFHLNL